MKKISNTLKIKNSVEKKQNKNETRIFFWYTLPSTLYAVLQQ